MKKFLKISLSLITLVFTLLVVGFFYVVNMDPNDHKDWISGKFEESTGLTLALNGEIGLTLYPWLGVSLNDVVVGNAPGFSDTPLLQAQQAEFRIKLVPLLLDREYEIDTIRLAGTQINLETSAAGANNWDIAATESQDVEESSRAQPVNRLTVGGVDIQDAALVYDDRFNDVRYELADISIGTGELVYGEPVDLYLGMNASATRPALSALVNFSGTVVYDLDNERYELEPLNLTSTLTGANVPGGSADIALTTSVIMDFAEDTLALRDFSLSALDAQINANINGSDISDDDALYQVNLVAAGNDLAVFFRVLENQALVDQITALNSRSFRLNALIESRPFADSLTITDLDANLLDATITGDINATNLQSAPIANGTINASGPDLPTLLEVAGTLQGGQNSELARYGRDLQQAPNQDFLLNTRFDANLETGNINLPEFEARILGATMNGNVAAGNINSDTPEVRGRLNASGPDLPILMQIAGQLTGGRESALNQYGRQLRSVSNKNFSINAPFDINMATGNIDLSGLEANLLGFRLNSSLQASNFENANGTMRGDITLSGRNLSQVLTAIDQADLAEVLQSINLTVSVNGTRNNLSLNPLNLDLVLSGPRIPNSPVTLALNANTLLNLEAQTLRMENFSVAGLGLDLQGSVAASNIMDEPSFNGQINLPAFNLRRFMQQVNQTLPPTMDNTVFGSLGLSTEFAGSSDDFRLNNLDLTLDESSITGDFTLVGFDNPAVDFTLAVNRINLDRYLVPATDTQVDSETGNAELPVGTLRELNIKGQFNVGQLTYSNLNLNEVSLAINASDGEIALAPLTASLYEGSYSGDIRLDARGDMPMASVDTSLTGINLGPLLEDFMDASYVSGAGNVQLSLTGRGTDTATIKRNLNGSGSMDLQDGVLQGVDVGSVLTQIEAMIREGRARAVTRGAQTPFETFSADISINNGVVASNNLLIESSGFDVTGQGTLVNLANDSIAFNLVASVDENPASDERDYDIGGYSLPIACSGTIASPSCLPDIQAILASAVSSAVQRGLTDLLQRAAGNESTEEQGETQEEQESQEEEADPREELINRALERLINR